MSYDHWKTTPPRDKRAEEVEGMLDNMNFDEIVKLGIEKGYFEEHKNYKHMEEWLIDKLYWESDD
jgi:hypothetical protein